MNLKKVPFYCDPFVTYDNSEFIRKDCGKAKVYYLEKFLNAVDEQPDKEHYCVLATLEGVRPLRKKFALRFKRCINANYISLNDALEYVKKHYHNKIFVIL